MTVKTKIDNRQVTVNWQYKIADADIEIKENQYLNAEAEYYKAVKTRPQKSFFENKKYESLIHRHR